MHLKEFTKYYQLHLLAASHKSVQLGDLVWKRWWGGNQLGRSGMGNNVFNRFYDAELMDQSEWKAQLVKLATPSCEVAELAQMHLRNMEKVSGLFLQALGPEWTHKKVMSLRIQSVCARVMSNETRMEIDHFMEQLSAQQLRQLFGRPKRVQMITELYYGQLKLFIEKEFARQLETTSQQKQLSLQLSNEGEFINEYDFENTEVPFAYRMEGLKKFNG